MTKTASGKAVAAHLRHIRLEGKSARTVYDRELTLKRLAKALPVPLLDATADDLYEWRAALEGLKDATVACYASSVLSFTGWTVKRGLAPQTPAADLPVPPVPHREPHPIADADLRLALSSAPGLIRIWELLACGCGLRAKEITLLRAECIRLREGTPHLRITHTATKGRRERTVPVPAFMIPELERADLYSSGLVFRKANGSQLDDWTVSKLCNQHLRSMGIPDVFHSLRHWYLTKAYAVEYNLRAVMELAGHAHIQTTAGYAAIDGSALARTANAIPSPLGDREAS